MTPEQLERAKTALKNAAAAAEAGDEQAAADATRIANAIKAARAAPAAPETNNASQFASGTNESLANVVGAPVDLMQGAINLGIKGINKVAGTDIAAMEGAVGSSDWIKEQGRKEIAGTGIQMISPEVEGYEVARRMGEFFGTGVGTVATLGAGAATGVTRGVTLADDLAQGTLRELGQSPGKMLLAETIAAPAAVAGGNVGGDLGAKAAEGLGANPETGRRVGETLGELIGGTGSTVAAYGGGDVVRGMFAADDSAARLAAAERAGVRPSYGLVGNTNAQYLENVSGLNPLSRGGIENMQTGQVAGVGDLADRAASRLTGDSAPARSKADAGFPVREAADSALGRLRTRVGMLTEQELGSLGGPEAAMSIKRTKDAINDAMPRLTPSQQKNMKSRLDDLEAMRVTGYDRMGAGQQHRVPQGTPIDKALDTQIRTRLGNRVTRLDAIAAKAKPSRAEIREARNLRHRIKTDIAQIDDNLGIRADQMDNWRRELGQETPDRGAVGSREQREAYAGVRDDQRIQAAREGKLGEFAQATGEKKRLTSPETKLSEGGDVPFLERMTKSGKNTREPQEVWNFLTQKDSVERLNAFKRNVSKEDYEQTLGNMLSLMGQPTSQTARTASMNTETFAPKKFLTEFKNLPPSVQQEFKDLPEVSRMTDDLIKLSEALASRGGASNPSGTTATAIIANIFGRGVSSLPTTILTLGTNKVAADIMASPYVAKVIGEQNPQLAAELRKILPQIAAGSAAVDTSEPVE